MGVAWTRNGAEPVATLLAEADRALYAAKNEGRNRVKCASDDIEVLAAM